MMKMATDFMELVREKEDREGLLVEENEDFDKREKRDGDDDERERKRERERERERTV
ncbi:hypothetical protein HYC85_023650 [Camellia sinensis]|uniref:Uncharacterized protein n=1 Tax=Camellia sinensis TaxID=4442 RepID=A0A7J7GHJ6_CAMSI|nr:hypothetical protein HYC85_023650 [Camellia sinensis]